MQEIKNTVTEMKISFNWFISELNMAKERISELEDISIETSKNWKPKRARTRKTEQNMQGLWDNYKSGNMCLMGNQKEEKATHSSTLTWKIPWMEEPGGLQSLGSLRVGHDWATSLSLFTFMHWRRKWQPTPVLLPGESQGRGSLVGCRLWGCTESDTTEVT